MEFYEHEEEIFLFCFVGLGSVRATECWSVILVLIAQMCAYSSCVSLVVRSKAALIGFQRLRWGFIRSKLKILNELVAA